jgi:uncharacterized protein (TIGR02421 family)
MGEQRYQAQVLELSERLVAAQRGIRILDAIKWSDDVRAAFFAADCREPPDVGPETYRRRPLELDLDATHEAIREVERDVASRLGSVNPAGRLLARMCDEYLQVLDLLEARGTPAFSRISQRLYGSSRDAFHAGGPTVADLAEALEESLRAIDESAFLEADVRNIPTAEAVAILQKRLDAVFTEPESCVRVIESDGIVADAAAGSDYIKLRKDALFSRRDLGALEAHEGWVHVGTTLNGRAQPWCTFLEKGTPSTTVTQEGLALLVELLAGVSHPARLRRITDRAHAIRLAEEGASFLEVFAVLREWGRSREESYTTCVRAFRGSAPDCGPFTKDLSYTRGFVEIYNFMQIAVRRGRLDRLPLLFCGKLTLDDLGAIADLRDQGVVTTPRHLPPPLADLSGLAAWLAFATFLNRLDLRQVEADYARLLA